MSSITLQLLSIPAVSLVGAVALYVLVSYMNRENGDKRDRNARK
jgi:uncharacterized membrane-anchored protein